MTKLVNLTSHNIRFIDSDLILREAAKPAKLSMTYGHSIQYENIPVPVYTYPEIFDIVNVPITCDKNIYIVSKDIATHLHHRRDIVFFNHEDCEYSNDNIIIERLYSSNCVGLKTKRIKQ